MAFDSDSGLWQEFLQAWPIERLRAIWLDEYATSGDKNCFVYWLEFRLADYGSIASKDKYDLSQADFYHLFAYGKHYLDGRGGIP